MLQLSKYIIVQKKTILRIKCKLTIIFFYRVFWPSFMFDKLMPIYIIPCINKINTITLLYKLQNKLANAITVCRKNFVLVDKNN